jgi:hypothetical protein
MPADKSTASGLARHRRSAALAAPVPAPASSTTRLASGRGLDATSSAAMGPYTSSAPSAHRRPDRA